MSEIKINLNLLQLNEFRKLLADLQQLADDLEAGRMDRAEAAEKLREWVGEWEDDGT